METQILHYFITGDQGHLKEYYGIKSRLGPEFARLYSNLVDGEKSVYLVGKLRDATRRHGDLTARAISLYRSGQKQAAVQIISGNSNEEALAAQSRLGAELRSLEYRQVEQLEAFARDRQWRRLPLGAIFILSLAGMALYANQARSRIARTVASLEQLKAWNDALFAAAGDAVIIMDEDGIIVSANPAAARMFNRSITEMVGTNSAALYAGPVPPGKIRQELYTVLQTYRSGEHRLFYAPVLGKDGAVIPAGINVRPFRMDEKLQFIAIFRDMSDQERMNRMKSEFVATVSHELRTPLTAISGSLNLLTGGVAGALPPQAKRLVAIANESCERLVRLINDILDIEKMESGKMSFDIKPVPLIGLVDQAIEANAGYASKFDVELQRSEMLECQNIVAMADADRSIQVLNNLISNAVKFSPPHGVVTVRILPGETYHRICVSDEGPGIATEFQGRLFQKFTQADSSDARQKGGTGLGLSITKQIVEHMGGHIGFETTAGQGTTFHVDLPVATLEGGQESKPSCSGGGARLLIYHDDESSSCALCKALCQGGFECHRARNREEAQELMARNSYAAILLGLHLAGDDPAGFIHDLSADRDGQPMPVLLISRVANMANISRPVFMFDWLEEPAGMDDLLARLAHLGPQRDKDPSRPVILHVDDDFHLLQVVSHYFADWADVHSVIDLAQARKVLAEGHVDLVIIDVHLETLGGLELLPELVDGDGTPLPVVIFSGHDAALEAAHRVDAILTKSRASLSELAETVQRLVAKNRAYRKKELPA